MVLNKIAALFVFCLILVGLFQTANWLVSVTLFGTPDLTLPIQSVPSLGHSGLILSIEQFVWLYAGLKSMGFFVFALISATIAIRFEQVGMVFATPVALLVFNYLLYRLAFDSRSMWQIVRLVNLFSFIRVTPYVSSYQHVNVAGHPMRSEWLFLLSLTLLTIIMITLLKHHYNRREMLKFGRMRLFSKKRLCFVGSIVAHEHYKLFVTLGGALVLAVLLVLSLVRSERLPQDVGEYDVH